LEIYDQFAIHFVVVLLHSHFSPVLINSSPDKSDLTTPPFLFIFSLMIFSFCTFVKFFPGPTFLPFCKLEYGPFPCPPAASPS